VTAQGPGGTGPGDNQQPDSQAHGGDWPADELAARRRMHARFWQGLVLPDVGVLLVELFVHQTCMLGAGYEMPIAELHEAYVAWCKASGREAESAQGFARDLKAASPQLSTGGPWCRTAGLARGGASGCGPGHRPLRACGDIVAGIEYPVMVHGIRHSFRDLARQHGVPNAVVKAMAGGSCAEIALRGQTSTFNAGGSSCSPDLCG